MKTAGELIFNLGFICLALAAVRLFQDSTPLNPRVLFWVACCYTCYTIGDALCHVEIGAVVSSAFGAVFWWLWWKNGGGKKTKRRLRKAAQAFKGVRRTAPVTT